jgi:hypothetical protein
MNGALTSVTALKEVDVRFVLVKLLRRVLTIFKRLIQNSCVNGTRQRIEASAPRMSWPGRTKGFGGNAQVVTSGKPPEVRGYRVEGARFVLGALSGLVTQTWPRLTPSWLVNGTLQKTVR